MRIALGIEYDGTAFFGWQFQHHARSVQQEVERALSFVANEPVRVVCAGRTDTGVHALGQVVHFETTAERPLHAWILGTNANLPADVSVTWAQPVADDFHARFSATARSYRYIILNRDQRPAILRNRVCWHHTPLDVEPMRSAAEALIGEHDFSSFRAVACQAKHPVRTVHRMAVERRGEFIRIDVTANAFLHHMVRNIAGVLMSIGEGARDPAWTAQLLEARDRTAGGVTAPAAGLYLVAVDYPAKFGLPAPPTPPEFG